MLKEAELDQVEYTHAATADGSDAGGFELLDPETPSRLLQYLPGIFSRVTEESSEPLFINGFLNLFDSYWQPLERQLDTLYAYFDPRLTPDEFVPWLGTWVDVVLDENWEPARRRTLIARAAELYRWRGTVWALHEHLKIYSGVEPKIVESQDDDKPFEFTVTVRVPPFD